MVQRKHACCDGNAGRKGIRSWDQCKVRSAGAAVHWDGSEEARLLRWRNSESSCVKGWFRGRMFAAINKNQADEKLSHSKETTHAAGVLCWNAWEGAPLQQWKVRWSNKHELWVLKREHPCSNERLGGAISTSYGCSMGISRWAQEFCDGVVDEKHPCCKKRLGRAVDTVVSLVAGYFQQLCVCMRVCMCVCGNG